MHFYLGYYLYKLILKICWLTISLMLIFMYITVFSHKLHRKCSFVTKWQVELRWGLQCFQVRMDQLLLLLCKTITLSFFFYDQFIRGNLPLLKLEF